ncbi:polysaccharide biosynthesis tyrosine autokinase [uncultured Sulfitobacter sp.]|uniref:GumC family protein n=1 Tax=uncultured Sulfitobacter sp. TaxID=191468 RepID=UPI00262CAE5F|nr:polysaccharide biosynthesis tyrosine autokinase [uncultured Sulfitobacter sp.]
MNNAANEGLRRTAPGRNSEFRGTQQDVFFTLNLGDIARILWRNVWLIALCAGLGGAVAVYQVLRVTPVYVATAQILLGQENRADDALGSLFQRTDRDSGEIYGEISIMTSGRFLSRVSETLSLKDLPEFNPALLPTPEGPGLLESAATGLKSTIKFILGAQDTAPQETRAQAGDAEPGAAATGAEKVRSAAAAEHAVRGDQAVYVDTLSRRLSVRQQGSSSVLDIRFMSPDPMVAAAVANTVADQYITFQLEDKLASIKRLTDGLDERISDMRSRLEASERRVIAFRSQSLDGDSGGTDWMDQQLGELSSRLVNATAQRSELEAERGQIVALIAQQGAAAAAGVLESDMIRRLQRERAEQELLKVRLQDRFGSTGGRLQEVADQITATDQALENEVLRILAEKENKVAVAVAREASVRRQFKDLKQSYLDWEREQIALSELERERDANRLVYETFLTTYSQSTETVALQAADARVINYAEPPRSPAAPRKKVSVALGLIAGLCAGLGLAFLRAYLDTSVDGTAKLRRLLGGVPVFASIPVARGFIRRIDPLKAIGQPRNAALTESMRTLRNMLIMGRTTKGLKIAVMSALPNEGKTTTSLLLAHAAAKTGKSVVVVETDLRRSSIASLLKVPPRPSLNSLTSTPTDAPLRDILHKDDLTGAYILPAEQGADDPGSLLLSDRMSALIERLEAEFDIIVFDTSPILSVSDALPILRQSDEIVLAVRWKKSSADSLADCMRQLRVADITPTCTVLTMVGRREAGAYWAGDYAVY